MIDPIAKLHSPTGSLVSLYVNRRAQATRAALTQLLKSLSQANGNKYLRRDADRILQLADTIESDPAPAAAVFASHRDGIFEFLPLTHEVEDIATVGPRPHLRPLRSQPRPMRVGVIVADTARARTFAMSGGVLHEYGGELVAERGKENYGGFSGYEEQRNRARAVELSANLWRQAGRRLLEAHRDQPLELLVIAGHDEDFDSIAVELHPYLRQLPQERLVFDTGAFNQSSLAEGVAAAVERERRRLSEELLDRLLAEAGRGGSAVTGLAPVLEACNAHAVEQLVVAGPFVKPGVMCDGCGWLARDGETCPLCETPTFPIDDVVSAAMDATVEAGGRSEIVRVASPLDADGVGAFLRFRVR